LHAGEISPGAAPQWIAISTVAKLRIEADARSLGAPSVQVLELGTRGAPVGGVDAAR
jgi:hypothetical protein